MHGIIINDTVYKVKEHSINVGCEKCDLLRICEHMPEAPCTVFGPLITFEEKGPLALEVSASG